MRTMAVVRKGHWGRAQLTKVDQGTDDCGSGTRNRVTARYREAAAQASAHGRQWLWQCRARLRGEVVAGLARAAVARAGSCSDGGSEREHGLRCRALVAAAAAAQGVGNGRALSSEGGGEAVGIMTKK